MITTHITNIGEFFTGDLDKPTSQVASLLIEGSRIKNFNPPGDVASDITIDAEGSAVLPGLVDGQIDPVFGEWTPAQD